MSVNSSIQKILHSLTFIDACWMFMETKQWIWMQWGSGQCVSAVTTATWKTSHILDSHAQLSHHKMKSILVCSSMDYSHGTMFRAEYWLQCVRNDGGNVGISQSLHQVDPMSAHTGKERTPYASLSGPTEPIRGWRRQFPGSCHYQWGVMVSQMWARIKMAVHEVVTWKLMCTVLWERKGVILLDFPEPGQTIISKH